METTLPITQHNKVPEGNRSIAMTTLRIAVGTVSFHRVSFNWTEIYYQFLSKPAIQNH